MSLIHAENLNRVFFSEKKSTIALKNVSLDLNIGETVGIIGESGSGKTTLINVLFGLLDYDNGDIVLNGKRIEDYKKSELVDFRNNNCAFINQNLQIFDNLTIYENLKIVLANAQNEDEKINEVLLLLELENHKDTKCKLLSDGQRQRVALARALCLDSRIIVADEPTSNLDFESISIIKKALFKESYDKLILIISHDKEFVKDCCNRIIELVDGKIVSDIGEKKCFNENITCKKNIDNKKGFNIIFSSLIKSNLKMNIFNFIIGFLLVVFCSFVFILCHNKIYEYIKKDYVFSNIENRIVISKINKSSITEDDLLKICMNNNETQYVEYDNLLDYDFSLYFKGDYFSGFQTRINTSNKLDCGRNQDLYNEVTLCLPISYKKDLKNFEVLFESSFKDSFGLNYFKVVGIDYYYDNKKSPQINFTSEGYMFASYLQLYNDNITSAIIDGVKYVVQIDDNIPDDSFYIYNFDGSSNHNVHFESIDYLDNKKNTSLDMTYYDYDKVENPNFMYVNHKCYIELFKKYNQENYQASLFTDSKNIFDYLKNEGYYYMECNSYYNNSFEEKLFSFLFSILLITFLILLLIVFSFVSKGFMKNWHKNMKTLDIYGITNKQKNKIKLSFILLQTIIYNLLLTLFIIILYRTEFGKMNIFPSYIMFPLVSIIVIWYLYYIYKEKEND